MDENVGENVDDDIGGEPVERPRFGMSSLQLIAMLLAVAFLSSAVTTWWANREETPNGTDVGFYDDMTTHHFQAIRMAHAYLRRGEDELLRKMAWHIVITQAGEVRLMQDSLRDWGEAGSSDVAMEWMDMSVPQSAQPGMATNKEMVELEAADGLPLADRFTALMMNHHAGGIHMARIAARRAAIGSVREVATSMADTQEDELSEMNFARRQLGLPAHRPKM